MVIKWLVRCQRIHLPFTVIQREVEADTADNAMKLAGDDEYSAVSVRLKPQGNHVYDFRHATL
jgi:hypothetical protein